MGPDEQIYVAQAKCVRSAGIHWMSAFRDMADEYIAEPTLRAYPSPLRWLWIALVAIGRPISERAVQFASAALIGPAVFLITHSWVAAAWAAASPLLLTLCGRRLQDVPVALATIGCVAAAQSHSGALAACVLVLLSLKESAILAIPAIAATWLLSGGPVGVLAGLLFAGLVAWLYLLAILFGNRAFRMLRAAASAHDTGYAADHQRGAPHRLLVDLFLASPAAVAFAILGAANQPSLAAGAAALLVAHAWAPIRNVRFVLAADVLLRVIGASAMTYPLLELPLVLAVDAAIYWRLRGVYDPVTSALTSSLGMSPVAACSSR